MARRLVGGGAGHAAAAATIIGRTTRAVRATVIGEREFMPPGMALPPHDDVVSALCLSNCALAR